MKKFKRFLRRGLEPIPFWLLFFAPVSLVISLFVSAAVDFSLFEVPNALEVLFGGPYSPGVMLGGVIWVSLFLFSLFFVLFLWFGQFLASLFILIKKRRKGVAAVRDNWIMVYVDDVVYDRLHQMADMAGCSVPYFCNCVLQCVEPDELAAAAAELHEEAADAND